MAHRVLILGGGFGGVVTAQELEKRLGRRGDVEIWLVSRDNFFLFTPLLPEVTSGRLEARHVVNPLRGMVKKTWCITAEVEQIDLAERVVTVLGGDGDLHRLRYDTLVLALGGVTRTFNIPGIEEYTVGMKSLADAFSLRNRIVEMFERADIEDNDEQRRPELTFVVGGGGFAGVQTAGEIEDFIHGLRRWYPGLRDATVRLYLVEAGERVLNEIGGSVSRYAMRVLEKRGFEVRLNTPLREVRENEIVVGDGEVIPTRTVVWTGGVGPNPLVAQIGLQTDRAGRAITNEYLETSHPGVFALGDCATIPNLDDPAGKPHPPTAQHALREAARLARNIVARIDGQPMEAFRYKTLGTLASLGHHTGVGVVFGLRVRGWIGWLMWRGYYWLRLPRFNRKVRVVLDWLLNGLFGTDPVQLKVEDERSAMRSTGTRRPLAGARAGDR